MVAYVVRRILGAIPVLLTLSLITFLLMHAVPGGPFDREKRLPPEIIANLESKYHLDRPLWRQYTDYIGGIVTRFDFGPTYRSTTRTVNDIFSEQLPVSAQLGGLALLIAIGIGIPAGIIAALRQNTVTDYTVMFIAILGLSIPNLALGPLLMWVFGLKLEWLPVATWGTWKHLILPAVTLGTGYSAFIARLTRASMLQVVREDYIRTARAKGLSESVIMVRHALKNGLIPVATVIGPLFAVLITGTVVVEQIFAVPGIGRYFVTSIGNRDYPVIMGTTLLFGVAIVVANLLVDLTYAFLDPRIRLR